MKIYNTLTRKKEEFVPIEEGKVKMYVCGPTVYNYFHIGNARPFVVFDTMRKYLEYRGYKVKYVQNFTDVDDKIINRAKEEGVSAGEISEKYIAEYFKDAAALNVKKATVHPKVTETMDDIIQFVQDLIDKGYAYESDGDVYYRARKMCIRDRIMTREDMPVETRIGSGFDVHKMTDGRKMILCGVDIPFEKGLLGHSDADVALHALMDAMLGAAALEDIGSHFPDTDDMYKGISSMELLRQTAAIIDEAGYRLANADVTIIAQRPKIAPYIREMRENIAEALGVDIENISVKATTTEKLGFTGREEGIAAQAVCLLNSK